MSCKEKWQLTEAGTGKCMSTYLWVRFVVVTIISIQGLSFSYCHNFQRLPTPLLHFSICFESFFSSIHLHTPTYMQYPSLHSFVFSLTENMCNSLIIFSLPTWSTLWHPLTVLKNHISATWILL